MLVHGYFFIMIVRGYLFIMLVRGYFSILLVLVRSYTFSIASFLNNFSIPQERGEGGVLMVLIVFFKYNFRFYIFNFPFFNNR